MKLQPDKSDVQTIAAYGPDWVGVNGEKITHSVLVGPHGQLIDWQCHGFDALTEQHFAQLAGLGAELVIFGSGRKLRFPPGLAARADGPTCRAGNHGHASRLPHLQHPCWRGPQCHCGTGA